MFALSKAAFRKMQQAAPPAPPKQDEEGEKVA
jgi:hypothetical protein